MAECGHRLLPNLIDETASINPNLTFVEVPKSNDIRDGLCQVTFGNLARCIDKCAWWIHAHLGKRHGFPTLAYIGPHDLRYLFLVFGACKAGHKVRLLRINLTVAFSDVLCFTTQYYGCIARFAQPSGL